MCPYGNARVLRSLLGLALVLLAAASAAAQEPPPPAAPPPEPAEPIEIVEIPAAPGATDWDDVPLATDTLQPRAVPQDALARYAADPDFQYDRPRAERPSLLSRIMDWLWRTLFQPILSGAGSEGGQMVLIVAAVLFFGWIVTRLLRADSGTMLARRDVARGAAGPLLDVEDIAEVNVEQLLADALEREDFREAVRFRYVLALQRLDARGAIRWRRHKTNREYVREARAWEGVAQPFAEATRLFDFVWYGERPVDHARYATLAPVLDRLDAALSRRQTAPAR